jgi:GMP synthase (glutamine-hydrolysing)
MLPAVIYIVDNSLEGQGESATDLARAFQVLRPGANIVVEHYPRVTSARIAELAPSHIVLSGQPSPWSAYAPDDLAGVYEVIRTSPVPILGVCGGHQQIALCYGAPVDLIQRIAPGEGYEGALRVRGFLPVTLAGGTLATGLSPSPEVWHSHCDEVKAVPDGFVVTASSATCRIEGMQHASRPVFGVQFHPERFDADHPDGRGILERFLSLGAAG